MNIQAQIPTLRIIRNSLAQKKINWRALSEEQQVETYLSYAAIEERVCICPCKRIFSCRKEDLKKYFSIDCAAKVGGPIAGDLMRGVPKSEETKEKLRNSPKENRKQTPEMLAKKAKAHRGWLDNLSPEAKVTWLNNCFHNSEAKEKAAAANAIKNTTLENRKKNREGQLKHWASLTQEEFDAKLTKSMKGSWKGVWRGYFKSYKNNCEIYFMSSYEVFAYIKLEHDDNVKAYGRITFSIPYLIKGQAKRYFPDLFVQYRDNSQTIIEIKPKKLILTEENLAKKEALDIYCRENNLSNVVWTEDNLPINKKEVQEDERKPNINLVKNGLSSIEILAA